MTDNVAPERRADTEFLRQLARTRRFSLGRPSAIQVASDGTVVFLRSGSRDPENALWALDTDSGEERRLASSADLVEGGVSLTEAEKERRERLRLRTTGITSFSLVAEDTLLAVPLGGHLFVLDLDGGVVLEPPLPEEAVDPRPDPALERVAYILDGDLWVSGMSGGGPLCLAGSDDPDVVWGLAEYVAREEMGRLEGFWWEGDGSRIVAACVDTRDVEKWWLSDLANPGGAPRAWPYPRPGRANADVRLAVFGADGASRVDVDWDREAFPYVARVAWPAGGPLTVLVQDRVQQREQVRTVDPDTGRTTLLFEEADPAWLNLPAGPLRWLPDGSALVWVSEASGRPVLQLVDRSGARRDVTQPELGLRRVLAADADRVVVVASPEPTEESVASVDLRDGSVTWIERRPGIGSWAGGVGIDVVTFTSLDASPKVRWRKDGGEWTDVHSEAEEPPFDPDAVIVCLGERALRASVVLPVQAAAEPSSVPVLLDVYAGPHVQRVLKSRDDLVLARWFADYASVAVVTIDGRGTPGRGRDWERALRGDFSGVTLEDQVAGLEALAEVYPQLDLTRVVVRGWSFGGYMAALCVLRRPDIFKGAIAGAPVTDWLDYDTHYTERYLGLPGDDPDAYRRSSLLDDAGRGLDRPLLIVHGTADDNVFFSHSVRLSDALLRVGAEHSLIPLAGMTHMADDEEVTIRLAELTARFIEDVLG